MLTNVARSGSEDSPRARSGPGGGRGAQDVAQLAELLVRTARRLQRSSIAELGPLGLTGAQARVVRHLEAAGHPLRMAAIAALLEVVPRTATTIVDDLERAGLIARATDPKDRRSVLVSLTEKGRLQLDAVAHARRRTEEATFRELSKADRVELMRLLAMCCGPCGCGDSPRRPTRAPRDAGASRGGGASWQ